MPGKLIVITGASSGIGEALAKAFAGAGHATLLLARRVERMEALKLENAMCRKCDVTKLDEITAAIAEAEAKYGPVDCIINNAGIMSLGEMGVQAPETYDRMIDVNIKGVFNGCHAVVSAMKERKCGTIFNMSSLAGIAPFPNHVAYCATKYAVHGLTKSLRTECWKAGVRVTIIAPGVVLSDLLTTGNEGATVDGYKGWMDTFSTKCVNADEVAGIVLYTYQLPQHVNIREIDLAATGQDA